MSINLKALAAPFPEEEIEWRVGQCGKNGRGVWAKCLAYVQARAIMNRLDAVCGPEGWKVEYQAIGQGFLAGLSIKIGDEWVTKWDGADQTDIESFKGGISSALKRAGSVWGIGRYLYRLESDYAKVVTEPKGAYWGKTKDGIEFYWLPPPLPAWALPDGSKSKALPAVKPAQPSIQDGFDHGGVEPYRIPFGKYAKRAIEEVNLSDLRSYVDYIVEKSEREKKPLTGNVADFVERATQYIADFENSPIEAGSAG